MTRWAESPGAAREHNEPLLGAVGTLDAGEPAAGIAAVKILLDHLLIDYMRRPLMGYFASRDGADYITPVGSIYGPKVMIIFYHDIDAWELYDLEKNPLEVNNVYDDPAYAGVVADLKAELARLQARYGDSEDLARKLLEQDLERQGR